MRIKGEEDGKRQERFRSGERRRGKDG